MKSLTALKIKNTEMTPHFYYSRFMNKDCSKFRNYHSVIFQEGYHKNARRMTVKIKKITLGSRFVIHLDEIIDKNF